MTMKKKIAVFACTLALMSLCTVFAFAEEGGADSSGTLWDLWALLNPENVNYLRVITILLTSIGTFFRMIGGNGGLKSLLDLLLGALKNLIPSGK